MPGDGDHGEVAGQGGGEHHLGEDQRRLSHLGGTDQLLVRTEGRTEVGPEGGRHLQQAPAEFGLLQAGGHRGRLAALPRKAEGDTERRRAHSVAITSRLS
jgi:hypothetical protein